MKISLTYYFRCEVDIIQEMWLGMVIVCGIHFLASIHSGCVVRFFATRAIERRKFFSSSFITQRIPETKKIENRTLKIVYKPKLIKYNKNKIKQTKKYQLN